VPARFIRGSQRIIQQPAALADNTPANIYIFSIAGLDAAIFLPGFAKSENEKKPVNDWLKNLLCSNNNVFWARTFDKSKHSK